MIFNLFKRHKPRGKLVVKPDTLVLPGVFDEPNFDRVYFDQVYLYKYALMLACQVIGEFTKKPMQEVWNTCIENAGAYIISINDQGTPKEG